MTREKITENLILKAATLYYTHKFTQEEIARKLGFSRPTVVRLLKQARDYGFVEIRITRQLPHLLRLETDIEAALQDNKLWDVIVVDGYEADAQKAVAKRTAEYLVQKLTGSDVLGIGWSSTLMNIPEYLWAGAIRPKRIVQLG